jgi:hypothetical protein
MVLRLPSDRAVADREPGVVKLFGRQLQTPASSESTVRLFVVVEIVESASMERF